MCGGEKPLLLMWRQSAQFLYINTNMDHQKIALEVARLAFLYLLVRTAAIFVLKKKSFKDKNPTHWLVRLVVFYSPPTHTMRPSPVIGDDHLDKNSKTAMKQSWMCQLGSDM